MEIFIRLNGRVNMIFSIGYLEYCTVDANFLNAKCKNAKPFSELLDSGDS